MLEIHELETLLTKHNIILKNWCHELATKDIYDLHNELKKGESTLEIRNNKLVRITRLSSIEIKVKLGEKTFTLIEDKQIFFTGAIRKRGLRKISEKMLKDETPEMAAYRGLQEEIGLTTDKKLIFLEEKQRESESASYPGLSSIYQVFNYQITLEKEDLESLRFCEFNTNKVTLFTLVLDE